MVIHKIDKSRFLPTFSILFPGAFYTAPKGTYQNAGKKRKKGDAKRHVLNTPFGWGSMSTSLLSIYIYLLFMVIH